MGNKPEEMTAAQGAERESVASMIKELDSAGLLSFVALACALENEREIFLESATNYEKADMEQAIENLRWFGEQNGYCDAIGKAVDWLMGELTKTKKGGNAWQKLKYILRNSVRKFCKLRAARYIHTLRADNFMP